MRYLIAVVLVALLVVVSRLGAMDPRQFEADGPRFIPEEYFQGDLAGYGVFYDRFGGVQTRFDIKLHGRWDGHVLNLDETLTLAGGDVTTRTYEIRKRSEHEYEARMPDLVGPARIESHGNVLRWSYTLTQKMGGRSVNLDFDDWMFLQPEGLVLNRAYARKFGIGVGEVFMVVKRANSPESAPRASAE